MNLNQWLRAHSDRVGAGVAVAAGLLALGLGYLGVRDALYPGQQIPYVISGGLVGLTLVGIGSVLWLSADLRDEWRLLDAMDHKIDRLLDHLGVEEPVKATAPTEPETVEAVPPTGRADQTDELPAVAALADTVGAPSVGTT